MSKAKFNPGPWHVKNRDKPYIMQENGIALAQIWDCSVISREQADANAALIAAAPEMYAELERICKACGDDRSACSSCNIKKILAKARGESEEESEVDK